MRIISGTLKGRNLKFDSNLPLRPSTEKVREALFSSLYSLLDIEGKNVLDLFAGSGAVGFEALSRGAGFVTFVEKNAEISKCLKININLLNLRSQTEVLTSTVAKSLEKLNGEYDFIFIDPPYEQHPGLRILDDLSKYKLLKANAIVVLESGKKFELSGDLKDFILLKEKIYGDTKLTFFKYQGRL